LITASIGVLLFPWLLLDRYQTWLISYSGLLGAVGGVIVCDYLLLRRARLDVAQLYSRRGVYWYDGGVNGRAMVATAMGALVAVAGKLTPALAVLWNGSWFSAGGAAFLLYYLLMRRSRAADVARAAA
jgi:NCS1 family nucleobase:cation symporter-1